MSSVNKVILIGNLGKDPEIKTLESGKKVGNFSLATSEKRGDETKTEWHNITVWEKTAEIAEKYLKKGSKIYLEGKIQTDVYEVEGVKKYAVKIIASNFTMLDSKPTTSSSESPSTPASKAEDSAQNYMKKNTEPSKAVEKQPEMVSSSESFDDDLPF